MIKEKLTYNDIYNTIREYHWMIDELDRLKGQFGNAHYTTRIAAETDRRRRKRERMVSFERRINFINEHNTEMNEQEKVVLDCLLDGVSINAIAANLRLHRKTIEKIRDRIILQLFENQ